MKFTAIILLSACLQVSAKGYSQITISETNVPLQKVFKEIQKQSGYDFLFSYELLHQAGKVTVKVNNVSLQQALNKCLKGKALTFMIEDKTVIIKKKPDPVIKISSTILQPQVTDITGKVTNENGEPLSGVSVQIKGTNQGAITDAQGRFTLAVADNVVLTISFIGYQTREIATAGKTDFSIRLRIADAGLNEVVVVGYGTQRKSDVTGSLSQVKSKEVNAYPATNVMQALSGRSAGVQILQNTGAPGAPVSVRIRGTNSIKGNNEPLYVIDGFPVSGNPTDINDADIESIEILKDASATAIYGSRGANGVVLITTVRGKAGKTRVNFESSYSSQTIRKKLDLMDAREYASFYNEQATNDHVAPFFTQDQINGLGKGFDWQNLIFQTAPIKTAGLNINGGDEKTRFAISGNIFGQDGIVKGSNYNRYSLRANIDHNMSEKFSVSLSSALTRLETERKDNGGGSRGNSMISSAISAPPTLTPFNDDGSYRVLATAYPFVATDLINPINFLNEQSNRVKANSVLVNAALIYKPIPDLVIKISGGIENRDDRTDVYTTRNFVNSKGAASVKTNQFTSLLSENTVSYNKIIHQHSLSAVAGFTYQDFLTTSLSASGSGFLSDASQSYNLGAADVPGIPGSGYSRSGLLSYLTRVNYSFNNKYLATVSVRADGSSKYSAGNKWGYFPSAALAWRVSNEDFLKNNDFISDLKLRASWGATGSQAIDAYATLNQLSSDKTVFGDALYTTYAPGTVLPGNLKWETTVQKDIGLDLGILKNRIFVTADYYIKNTHDLLNTVTLPSSLGFTTTIQNVGEVANRGFELGVDAKILEKKFKWNVNANISFNRNKVIKLYGGEDILGGSVNVVVISDNSNILREGQPIGMFWGYEEDGYNDKGKIKFKDLNKDGSITANDKTYIGNPNPKFIYGFNSVMSYKNFEFTVFIQGTQGNDIFNISSIGNTIDYGFGLNMPEEVFTNHWSSSNTNAKYPVISYNTTAKISNRFVEDGSYIRLKNISLAYKLPVNKMLNWVQSLQLFVSGQNLLTFTKYSWWDPEINSNGGTNSTAQGYDNYSYPSSRSFTFGIRAQF